METLWGIIVIIIAVAVSFSQNKKKLQKTGKREDGGSSAGDSVQKFKKQAETMLQSVSDVMQQNTADRRRIFEQQSQKQRELKQRLLQKYGRRDEAAKRTLQSRRTSEEQEYDILDRAEANVNEIQTDAVKRSLFEAQSGAAPAGFDMDWEDGDSLMREVEDLMITGYQYSLSYERDFVGEGIEMLNGIEMPEVPEYIA